jgi:Protein of unknown function (DUF2971)
VAPDLDRERYFFHYTSREAAFEHILPTGRLRRSPLTHVNDPLENRPWLFPGAYLVDEDSPDADARKASLFRFVRGALRIWDASKLLALSIDAPRGLGYQGRAEPFGRGWARARMWDQYAEGHRGVCLLFDREKLTEAVRALQEQGLGATYHGPVKYTNEGPLGSSLSLDLQALPAEITPHVVAEFIDEHNEVLFFLKTSDWDTEFEYRFIVVSSRQEDVLVDYGDAFAAVIVGERFPPWQRASGVEACQRAGVEALRLDWSTRRPRPTALKPLGLERFNLYAALKKRAQDEPPVPPAAK